MLLSKMRRLAKTSIGLDFVFSAKLQRGEPTSWARPVTAGGLRAAGKDATRHPLSPAVGRGSYGAALRV